MAQIKAEQALNPLKYRLSNEALRHLKWMYTIKHDFDGNIKKAASKIGVSRTWLSTIYNRWKKSHFDPRALEPTSKAPKNTNNRERISDDIEDKIIEVRKKYHPWGKDKLKRILERDYKIKVGASTINRRLLKNNLIDMKLSDKNERAWDNKKGRMVMPQKFKMLPPDAIKDYRPGALVGKDMKFILKRGVFTNPDKHKAKENFWLQHTLIDSFTRIRALEMSPFGDSKTSADLHEVATKRFPFPIACLTSDNGSENEKYFDQLLIRNDVTHFFSRPGTPTDNPRTERSHLTDENEFYRQGNIYKTFEEQQLALSEWEHTYNFIRPHQALGQLTPMEFYSLWTKDPKKAHEIADTNRTYLKKQSKRLATSRKLKKKELIEQLMRQIDAKLSPAFNR